MLSLVLALIGRLWEWLIPAPRPRTMHDPLADEDVSGWGHPHR